MIKKPKFTDVNENFEIIFNPAGAGNMNRTKLSLHLKNRTERKYPQAFKHALVALVSALLFSAVSHATPADNRQDQITLFIEATEQRHQQFSESFQAFLLTQPQWFSEKQSEIEPLLSVVKQHIAENNSILAANTLFNNMALLNQYYDDKNIPYFISILLNQNDTKTAQALFDLVNQQGGQALISNSSYQFAIFSFRRNEWQKTEQLLDGIINDLVGEDYQYALLMQGVSLQKLKRHRDSLAYYEKIEPTSSYYLPARLNMAIANIRQGWWTDAHITIQNTLKSAEATEQEETINRLYLTLGYSLLSQKNYRDSRNYFRNISVDSLYANRALLGITLAAANQNDFVGALNSANILKEKQSYQLPVDESHLLTPYFYEKLQQPTTASAGYLEAINYYQKRVTELQSLIDSDIALENHPIQLNINATLEIEKNPINFSAEYPDYFFENYLKLKTYEKYFENIDNKTIKNEYEQLNNQYQTTIIKMVRSLLKKRVEQLNSYMAQSRFGLARLYDSHLVDH